MLFGFSCEKYTYVVHYLFQQSLEFKFTWDMCNMFCIFSWDWLEDELQPRIWAFKNPKLICLGKFNRHPGVFLKNDENVLPVYHKASDLLLTTELMSSAGGWRMCCDFLTVSPLMRTRRFAWRHTPIQNMNIFQSIAADVTRLALGITFVGFKILCQIYHFRGLGILGLGVASSRLNGWFKSVSKYQRT